MGWRGFPYFPLGSAFPGMAKVGENPVAIKVADELGVTPAQVGPAWLLAHARNTLLIPGTADIDHLDANLAVGDIDLTPTSVAALDATDVASTTAEIDPPQWPTEAR